MLNMDDMNSLEQKINEIGSDVVECNLKCKSIELDHENGIVPRCLYYFPSFRKFYLETYQESLKRHIIEFAKTKKQKSHLTLEKIEDWDGEGGISAAE